MYQKGGIKVISLISSESLRNLWYLLGIFGIFLNHVRIFAISEIFMEPLDRFKRNIFSPYFDIQRKSPPLSNVVTLCTFLIFLKLFCYYTKLVFPFLDKKMIMAIYCL